MHFVNVIALFAIKIRFHRQQGHSDNGIHGGANLMTHIGKKITFRLIGRICLFHGD